MESKLAVEYPNNLVEIRQSSIEGGGSGIFVNLEKLRQLPPSKTYSLIVVKRSSTISLEECQKVLQSLEETSKASELLCHCLDFIHQHLADQLTETLIVFYYVIGYHCIIELGLDVPQISKFKPYLQVLLKTEVNSIQKDSLEELNAIEPYMSKDFLFQVNLEALKNDYATYERFIKSVEIFGITRDNLTVEQFLQLKAAVKSRTLEIPGKILDDDQFSISITIVPILDYINHSNCVTNSFFDVNKENDIVLKFEYSPEAFDGQSSQELFISYLPLEDVGKLFFNSGFIPTDDGYKVIQLPINEIDHQLLIENELPTSYIFFLQIKDNEIVEVTFPFDHMMKEVTNSDLASYHAIVVQDCTKSLERLPSNFKGNISTYISFIRQVLEFVSRQKPETFSQFTGPRDESLTEELCSLIWPPTDI
ncbi:BA75_01387T0 [Komagataella pastoris]|uniref:BA75_01387T0 n=1 Tax=Komagataella pastoris TaxID=4922 RepID=A0A1B2J808_PICPA|nr:BA75_01387T0 [Komagataella pastoris]